MTDHKENVGVKRRAEETNDAEPKQKRIDNDVGIATDNLKLTDVVDDCLERIFVHLSLDDLLSIAHTNKQLKPAADTAFQRKFGKTEFDLCTDGIFSPDSHIIEIYDKKTQLRLLRCFGHSITKLAIWNGGEFGEKLMMYSSEYSCDSLTVFRMNWYNTKWSLKKPFSNVRDIEFFQCKMYADMDFNKWFPAVRNLDLIHCFFDNKTFIMKTVQHLKQLKIFGNIRAENILACLHHNPQLCSLSLDTIDLPKQFWNACQALEKLEHLKIEKYYNDLFPNVDTVANLSALTTLDISVTNHEDLRVMASKITFDHLKDITLEFVFCLYSIDLHPLLEFFEKHPSIEKVTLTSVYYNDRFQLYNINESVMTKIAQKLPSLKEFNNFCHYSSIDEILQFVEKFKLMRYGFEVKNQQSKINLMERLGSEFHASFDGRSVEVIRKS